MTKDPLTAPCHVCGHAGPHSEGDATPPHGNSVRCSGCSRHLGWVAKDPLKRTDRNAKHRYDWKKRHDGDLLCHWCLIRASETAGAFDIDHIHPREEGGVDELRNTRPLCSDCHVARHAAVNHQRHVRGKSARPEAA